MSSGSGSRSAADPPTTTSPPPSQQPYFAHGPIEPQPQDVLPAPPPPTSPPSSRKRKAPGSSITAGSPPMPSSAYGDTGGLGDPSPTFAETSFSAPPPKKSRTNTPWTPAEEQRLKTMREAGNSWSEIAKTFPNRTEGSVKKHWYKDMHYADFAEDEEKALLQAIKEYEASKWKVIGQKVGKPAKACEQYAKEHFGGRL
ncbi:hypothetical protein G7Y79_00012g032810 [Physcia stellaris]|nr:hypothetical protein G7Y79_00012g032810 [Physcia stellaris]